MTAEPRRIVLATRNPGKLREIRALLAELPAELVSAAEAGAPAVPETGETFEENATKKAVETARATGLLAIADDSGLEVPALGGEPGVRSSRYSEAGTDAANLAKLRTALRARGLVRPEARFVCVAVLASPSGVLATARGEVRGVLLEEPRGENGFGYDPLFYHEELSATFAEVDPGRKESVSHRGRALRALGEATARLLEGA